MTTTNNDHAIHIRDDDEEPPCKRAKYTNNDVCIDLNNLMSFNKEIIQQSIKTTNTSLSTQNEDAGDSGFQELSPNDSPSSKDATSNMTDDELTRMPQQTTFSTDHQFIQLNEESQDTEDDNLNNIQLYDLNDDEEDSSSYIDEVSDLDNFTDSQKFFENWKNSFRDEFHNLQNLYNFHKFIMMFSEPPKRKKLTCVNSIEDVVNLIKHSKKIIVLTGAGISVSSGIPDFRSSNGIYSRLCVDFPELPNPQAMFCLNYFKKDQRPFFKFAKEIYPGQFKPGISHKFIKLIECNGKLLRNYTQNVDTLEKSANIERVITCHGSFSTASCTNCKYQVDGSFVKEDIFAQRIPRCPKCPKNSEDLCVLKPDIVFFGESLPDEFHDSIAKDKEECDLLIVIGSSLKVKPVAIIPSSIPVNVPQILINRENLSHMTFDVELLGDCDVIIQELCNRLGEGWNSICVNERLKEIKDFKLDDFNNKIDQANEEQETIKSNSSLSDDSPSKLDSKEQCADLIPDDSYVFIPPARYLFKGAEVYSDSDNDSDEDSNESKQSNL